MLKGKNILLGVTGSIAAYKAAYLVRLFVKEGASVKVIMTPASKEFVSPLTLSTLSKNPVLSEYVNKDHSTWNNHVELGLWADMLIIAPASANTLAKMASGICDNLLLATYLSARCTVYFAPAMDMDMYKHPSTRNNIKQLISYGNILIPPATGELASGLTGEGRLAEPDAVFEFISSNINRKLDLRGKKALVTAGPTYELIDPVRFIGNFSSGKMGIAIAEELAARGAEVVLICGPIQQKTENPKIKRIDVISAIQMHKQCVKEFNKTDIAVMAAAVADFTPSQVQKNKIKKGAGNFTNLELAATKDILKELGQLKNKKQVLVGFALETDDELKNAGLKLKSKNLDFIVLNSLKDKGAGFQSDTNKITIIHKGNKIKKFELKSKREVAADIVDEIKKNL